MCFTCGTWKLTEGRVPRYSTCSARQCPPSPSNWDNASGAGLTSATTRRTSWSPISTRDPQAERRPIAGTIWRLDRRQPNGGYLQDSTCTTTKSWPTAPWFANADTEKTALSPSILEKHQSYSSAGWLHSRFLLLPPIIGFIEGSCGNLQADAWHSGWSAPALAFLLFQLAKMKTRLLDYTPKKRGLRWFKHPKTETPKDFSIPKWEDLRMDHPQDKFCAVGFHGQLPTISVPGGYTYQIWWCGWMH